MAYGTNYAPQYGVPQYSGYTPTYTPPALPYQQPRMDYQQMAQQPQTQQPGTIFARIVTGREEAVAAQVLPDGNINAFIDRAHGRVYLKQVNPQTGVADFVEYVDMRQLVTQQPVAPQAEAPAQYVTVDAFKALRDDVEQIKAAMAQPAPRQRKGADSE